MGSQVSEPTSRGFLTLYSLKGIEKGVFVAWMLTKEIGSLQNSRQNMLAQEDQMIYQQKSGFFAVFEHLWGI